ncbi:ArpU family phage packaging/lysis transcriptional regulator [Bacillus safensis]|uniref:ArpU family phage packaging/lysis transcriptional regulator n=1 Tax=Bacillus safensis TaxID=561879 RepID=UPI003C1CE720
MTNKNDKNPKEQTDQMNLDIPQIDEEKTRFKMEKMMGKYKMLRLQTPEDFLPKITTTYTITPPSFSNQFHSSTEEAALKKMDWEIEREKYMKRIERGINRLTQKERRILVMLYMQDEEMFDYEIYAEMGLSQRNYYRVKNKAYYRLAFALREEVYKQGDKS